MNKAILKLPKKYLNKYVIKNFPNLTVEDYFLLVEKGITNFGYYSDNKVLNSSSEVLGHVLNVQPQLFREFDESAFSLENIEFLVNLDLELNLQDMKKYPIFFTNKKLIKKVIDSISKLEISEILRYIPTEQFDEEIIKKLEELNVGVEIDIIDKLPFILGNSILLKNTIKKNPSVILKVRDLDEELVRLAFQNGFIPTKDDYQSNPELKEYDFLVYESFKLDPSLIVLLNKKYLKKENNIISALQNVEITEEDLKNNNDLCSVGFVMEYAIKKNPRLIIYINEDCILNYSIVYNALQSYKITKEDLENNPAICRNSTVMSCLPQFKLYSQGLSGKDKVNAIIDCLKSGNNINEETLPFFNKKFGSAVDINKASEVAEFLNISIDETNMDEQERYYHILDKVIDSIIEIRYSKMKRGFEFSDIVLLNDYIYNQFEHINSLDDFDYDFLISTTCVDKEYIYENIRKFYNIYLEKDVIDLSITSDFCNKLLNEHRNYFFNEEKKKILKDLSNKMELSLKKKNSILNGIRLKRAGKFISCKDFQKLGITEEEYFNSLEQVKNSILNNKDIKKSEIVIEENYLSYLANYFSMNGDLDYDIVKRTLEIEDDKIIEFIISKFEKMLIKFAKNISIRNMELKIFDVKKNKLNGLNYNDYLIASKDVVYSNIANILVDIDNNTMNKILNNKDILSEILYLMPFVGFFPELDINKFVDILSNYDKVREKIGITGSKISTDMSLSKLADLITLSFSYGNIDNISLLAIGPDVATMLMRNINAYINCYRKMLDRYSSNVPPVFLQTNEYNFESGLYSDPERLLIGKKPADYSCIDLFSDEPTGAYREVLLEKSGDVILIRNKSNELISRMFVFRRGNVVQLVNKGGENYDMEIYKEIANQIISASLSNNDNIDYVFVNERSIIIDDNENKLILDKRFYNDFPHADLEMGAMLLSSKAMLQGIHEEELNLNFSAQPKSLYEKARKSISYNPMAFDITKIRALNVFLENDINEKQTMVKNFEPFYGKEYEKVVCGEDWYIALKNNGEIEELILPLNDERSYEEFLEVKDEVFGIHEKRI